MSSGAHLLVGDFRLRDPAAKTISASLSVLVVRVFFPLISVILPKWLSLHCHTPPPLSLTEEAKQQQQAPCDTQYKLLLVSGAGHCRDDSTQQLSALLSRFVSAFYPLAQVTQLYSAEGQDIFRYAENIKFVHSQLRPAIDRERLALAAHHGKHWHRFFNLSLTLCDGTPARLSAMIEGLRSFEPDMLHM